MKLQPYILLIAVLFTPFMLTSCELVGNIFEAGVWVGVIAVVLVIALVIWVIRKIF